eukprot:8893077-Pyramimonas_sp.AAC.1
MAWTCQNVCERLSGPFCLRHPHNAKLEDVAREMIWPALPETFRNTGAPITTSLIICPASLFPLPAWLLPPPASRCCASASASPPPPSSFLPPQH